MRIEGRYSNDLSQFKMTGRLLHLRACLVKNCLLYINFVNSGSGACVASRHEAQCCKGCCSARCSRMAVPDIPTLTRRGKRNSSYVLWEPKGVFQERKSTTNKEQGIQTTIHDYMMYHLSDNNSDILDPLFTPLPQLRLELTINRLLTRKCDAGPSSKILLFFTHE
jgi:hypothetical protein